MLGSFILCIVILKLSIGHLYSYMCNLNSPLQVYFIIFLPWSRHREPFTKIKPLPVRFKLRTFGSTFPSYWNTPLNRLYLPPRLWYAGYAHVCPINKTAAAKNCYSTCIEWKFPENDRLRSFIIAPKNNTIIQNFRGK